MPNRYNETTKTAVFWFLCVANVYIDPVKNTNFSNQSGRDADGHSLSLYVDFLGFLYSSFHIPIQCMSIYSFTYTQALNKMHDICKYADGVYSFLDAEASL